MTKHGFGLVLVSLALATIFGPPLWRGECPAYRDAGHFYFPTLAHTTERWSAGQLPLWNSYDNAGQPLAADATSAVFYPGRVLLHFPIGFERRITLYVACHWLLAIFGARRLAKRFTTSTDLQYFAALLFGLSGYVAGQCFNVVFLVGAAWLPWAWDAWEALRINREPHKAALLAVPLAMMVLGGDPQIAYHVALLALLDSISWRRSLREASSLLEPTLVEGYSTGKHLTWPWFRSRWMVLALACLLAIGLSGVQVLPSATWSLRSDRAAFDQPRSIWEWMARPNANQQDSASAASFFSKPAHGTHDENLYDFSFAPIRMLEFAAPGVFGEIGPRYQNWLKALTPSQRWWTTTNYLGLLTLSAATVAIWSHWSNRLVRAAAYVALLSLLSSFGVWGVGSIWNSVARQWDGASEVAPAAGGLYWFWVSLLPGYAGFRYPSKWLVFFSLAIVLLSARGMSLLIHENDEDNPSAPKRTKPLNWLPHCFVLLACFTSIAWIVLLLLGTGPFTSWGKAPPHPLFGPFDVDGALRCARFALARTCCVSLVLAGLLFGVRDMPSWIISRALMLLTIAEVTLAIWYGPIFDHDAYWMKAPVASNIADTISPGFRIYRASSARLEPAAWRNEFDSKRLEALRLWERSTLMPRYHWLAKLRLVESRGTMISAEYAALLDFLHRCPPDDREEPAWTGMFHPYDMLSARYCIVPAGADMRDAALIKSSERQASNFSFCDRKVAPPRAWIARSVALVPEMRGASRSALARQTSSILLHQGEFRDLLRETLVESNSPDALFSEICSAPHSENPEPPTWVADEPEHVELLINLDRPGLLILADAYSPGWTASRESDSKSEVELTIFRANRVLRGICLPAGRHRVHFRYRPWEIPLGGVISLLTWLIGLPAATFLRLRAPGSRLHAPFRRRRRSGD